MHWQIGVGLAIQVAALVLVFGRLGHAWLKHVGAFFIGAAVAYHGLNEILLLLFPDRNPYRRFVQRMYVDEFVLWVSIAILVFTMAYLIALGRRSEAPSASTADRRRMIVGRVFDWRLMLIAAIPLMLLALTGRGSLLVTTNGVQRLDFAAGLSLQFLLPATVLASLGIVYRFGRRWLVPVLLFQSVLIVALTAQRLQVLVAVGMLLYASAQLGIAIKPAHALLLVAAFLGIGLVLTSARAAEGRIATTSGAELRLEFLTKGVANLGSGATRSAVAADLGYRLDGNSFGALELQSLASGSQPLGFTPLWNDVLLAVPSFLNPDKNLSPVEVRNEKAYAETHLNLPLPPQYMLDPTGSRYVIRPGAHLDILTTQLGVTTGYWGPVGLLIVAALLGTVFGIVDRWILRNLSPTRLLIGVGLLSCVLYYETSWETYTITFRGILLLLPLVWIVQWLRTSSLPHEEPIPQLIDLAGPE